MCYLMTIRRLWNLMRINGGLGAETEASEGEQATEEAQLALKVPTQNANESAREFRVWCFSLAGVACFPKTMGFLFIANCS